ncbi:unnamed protein product [Lymnaea stagnalis]|uniref:Uncharacterized protein n=1 Tax=Lymnaea stagnalis TaxID=6523 RepID=A0AAV2I7H3_LYMST
MLDSEKAPHFSDLRNENLRRGDDIIIMPRKFIKKLLIFVLFACSAVALYLVLFASHKGNVNAEWNAIIEKLKVEAASHEKTTDRENQRRKGDELMNEGNVGPPPLMVEPDADNDRRIPERPAMGREDEEYEYDVEREDVRGGKSSYRGKVQQDDHDRFRVDPDRDNDGDGRGDDDAEEVSDTDKNDERERQDVIVDRLNDEGAAADVVDRVKADKINIQATVPREFLITNDKGEVIEEKLFEGGINHLLKKRPLDDGSRRGENQDKGDDRAVARERVGAGERLRNEDLLKGVAVADGEIDLDKNLNGDRPDAPPNANPLASDQNRGLAGIPNANALLKEQAGNKMQGFRKDGAAENKWDGNAFENGKVGANNNNVNNNGLMQDANINLQANIANAGDAQNGGFKKPDVTQRYVAYLERNGLPPKQIQKNEPNARWGNPVEIKGIPQQGVGANEQGPDQNKPVGNIDPQAQQQQQQQKTDQLLQKIKDLPPQMIAAILKQQQDMILQGQGLQQPDVNEAQPQQGMGANEQGPDQNKPVGNIDPQVQQQQQQQKTDQLLQKIKDLPPQMIAAILKQHQDMILQGQGLQQPNVNDAQPQMMLQGQGFQQPVVADAHPQLPENEIEQNQQNPNDDPQRLEPEFQNQVEMNLKKLPPKILAQVIKQQQEQLQKAQNVPIEQAGDGAQLPVQRDNAEQRDQNQPDAKPEARKEQLFIEDLSVPLPIQVNCVEFSFPSGRGPLCIHQGDKDPDMSAKIETNGSYEKDIMDQFTHILLSDPTLGFIDIGSGIGVYTIAAALLNRQVLSVEPLFRNYRLIHKSALENNVYGKILLVTMALDNESYVGHMSYTDTGGYSKVLITRLTQDRIQDRANVVHVTTLNNLAQSAPTKRALMKLDVSDGLEVRILQAADQFFSAVTVPHIITHWSRSAGPDKHEALHAQLTGLGYQPKQAWNGAVVNKEFLSNDVAYIVWSKQL